VSAFNDFGKDEDLSQYFGIKKEESDEYDYYHKKRRGVIKRDSLRGEYRNEK
jgi:hypothetical protein